MTGEERKEYICHVVDLGCGRGVCASVELKGGGPFIRLLGGKYIRARARRSRLRE